MRAFGNRTLKQKVIRETNKYMQENFKELSYQAVCSQAPAIMRQSEAVMLYALSLHGFGAKRLNDFHEWYCAIMNMPVNVIGKKNDMHNVLELMKSKYGIDFEKVKPDLPSFEEYQKDEG